MNANWFADRLAAELEGGWHTVARANQLPPDGDWTVWLLLAGRGFGKTRTLAEHMFSGLSQIADIPSELAVSTALHLTEQSTLDG